MPLFETEMNPKSDHTQADKAHMALFGHIRDNNITAAHAVLSRHIQRVKAHVLNGLEKLSRAKGQAGI